MNARKALDQYCAHAKVPWLHGCMLARRTFSVVVVADYQRRNSRSLVGTLHRRNFAVLARELVQHLVGFAIEGILGTDEGVVGNVVQVPAVAKPWSGH